MRSENTELYRTETVLTRDLRVRYPVEEGRIVLRTDLDWDRDIEAASVSGDRTSFTFRLEAKRPFLYFKPCLRIGDETHWAVGANSLVLMIHAGSRDVYPHFFASRRDRFRPWSSSTRRFSAGGMPSGPTCPPATARTR